MAVLSDTDKVAIFRERRIARDAEARLNAFARYASGPVIEEAQRAVSRARMALAVVSSVAVFLVIHLAQSGGVQ